jgi:hypothetical protein
MTNTQKKEKKLTFLNHISIFILKTTGTLTPVHSTGYLILRNELRSTQEVARQNIQVSLYIRIFKSLARSKFIPQNPKNKK